MPTSLANVSERGAWTLIKAGNKTSALFGRYRTEGVGPIGHFLININQINVVLRGFHYLYHNNYLQNSIKTLTFNTSLASVLLELRSG